MDKRHFWEYFADRKIFLGFKVTGSGAEIKKIPVGVDGVFGAAAGNETRLGTYIEAAKVADYTAISLMQPCMVGDEQLVCIDFDWKRATDGKLDQEGQSILDLLREGDYEYEESASGLGAHIWVTMREQDIPTKIKYANNSGIEIFSGIQGQRANVIFTNFYASGVLKSLSAGLFPEQKKEPIQKTAPSELLLGSTDRVANVLAYVNTFNDYESWLKVGMAVKDELGDAGFDIWDKWSAQADNYNAEIMADKWESFKGSGVGFGSVVNMARDNGMSDDILFEVSQEEMELGAQAAEALIRAHKDRVRKLQEYDAIRLKATEYVIDGFIGMGLTILAGEPGGGKTSIVVPLIAHAAHLCDKKSFLKPELRRHVVYVSEDTEQVERCIYAMNQYGNLGIGQEEFSEWFHLHEAHRATPRSIAQMLTYLDEQYTYSLDNGFVVKPVIVFDTSNATIDIENENDNSEVGKVIALLKESANGMAIIVVAHTAKALQRTDLSSLTPRGASAWIGDARATIYLFSDESVPEARFLALGKRRFEPTYTEIRFDSETYTEVVATPWGSSQSVGLRVVTAEASSQEERKQAAKLGKQAANSIRLREQELVVINQLQSLPRDQYRTMNELIEQLTGAKSARLDIVHGLINKKEIELFSLEDNEGVPKRVKQHKDGLRISPTYEQESNG
jgi:hypothetical protein